jgi:hypothetical protein
MKTVYIITEKNNPTFKTNYNGIGWDNAKIRYLFKPYYEHYITAKNVVDLLNKYNPVCFSVEKIEYGRISK